MTTEAGVLRLWDVRFGFPTRPDFLGPVSIDVAPGDCWSIVGPNGAGKTTLLRLIAGLSRPTSGVVSLDGRPIESLSLRERARRLALVPQRASGDLDITARELVLLGRYPYRSFSLFESPEDERVAARAMKVTGIAAFADRRMETLSGGEAQRVNLAAALAQEPAVLLLDEPTSSLDLRHQLGIHGLLTRRAADNGVAVVVVTHDVNLARRFSTHVLMLADGTPVASGAPDEVLQPERLTEVYGVDMIGMTHAATGTHWLAPRSTEDQACKR